MIKRSDMEWDDRLLVGVELIDQAHRRLFSIVRKVASLLEEESNREYACREGIKYLKAYTLQHFQEEEDYMRSVDYPDRAVHMGFHAKLREVTIPEFEKRLEASNYAPEDVEAFLEVCVDWLTGHIMAADQAIVGKDDQCKGR